MADESSFAAELRAISVELETLPQNAIELNRLAGRLDQVGRRLHGLDWLRDREIGGCLTAAVSELSMTRSLPGGVDPNPVRRAIVHLGAALTFADEGLRPTPGDQQDASGGVRRA